MQADFYAECRRLAELTHERYCRCIDIPLYLCGIRKPCLDTHNPQLPIWASLTVATEHEEFAADVDLVCPVPLPRHLTVSHLTDEIRSILRNEPLWIFAD